MRNSRKKRELKKTYAIIVDGETEKWYFEKMREYETLKVDVFPKVPKKKSLDEIVRSVQEESEKGYDKVFWLIDLDVYLKEEKQKKGVVQKLNKNIEQLKKYYENVEVLVNCPCLEFWFLLHFENTSKFYEECASVESILKTKKYIENYEKSEGFFKKENSDIYKKLKEKQTFACENARKLPAFDKQQPEQPAAEIYKIIVTLVQNKR